MVKSSMEANIVLSDGIEKAVVADDRPTTPTIWWKKPGVVRTLIAAAILIAAACLIGAISFHTMHRPKDSNVSATTNSTYFRPSMEPSSSPPPTFNTRTNSSADEDATKSASSPTASPTTVDTETPTSSSTIAPTETPPPFAFYVMGDVPYTPTQTAVLKKQLTDMTANRHPGSAFAVHVGDFQRWQITSCSQETYQDFRTLLLKSPVPTLVISGDNDYLDCPDPTDAWDHFLGSFSDIEKNWTNRLPEGIGEIEVNRWWGQRPEMFSFVSDGVLFMSSNLLNAPEEKVDTTEWNSRMADNAAWIQNEFEAAFFKHDIRGVVMFSHAKPSHIVKDFYTTIFEQVFSQRPDLPVLNFHGDGHLFSIETNFSFVTGWNGFTDIQVDQGGKADPLLVEIAPLRNGEMQPFEKENKMQYVYGDGLFRIDRQNGRYS